MSFPHVVSGNPDKGSFIRHWNGNAYLACRSSAEGVVLRQVVNNPPSVWRIRHPGEGTYCNSRKNTKSPEKSYDFS
jgi:hypothetical protein